MERFKNQITAVIVSIVFGYTAMMIYNDDKTPSRLALENAERIDSIKNTLDSLKYVKDASQSN